MDALVFLSVIPWESASSFVLAVALAFLSVIPWKSASSFVLAVALAFLSVIPWESASSFVLAVALAFLSVIPLGNLLLLLPLLLSSPFRLLFRAQRGTCVSRKARPFLSTHEPSPPPKRAAERPLPSPSLWPLPFWLSSRRDLLLLLPLHLLKARS